MVEERNKDYYLILSYLIIHSWRHLCTLCLVLTSHDSWPRDRHRLSHTARPSSATRLPDYNKVNLRYCFRGVEVSFWNGNKADKILRDKERWSLRYFFRWLKKLTVEFFGDKKVQIRWQLWLILYKRKRKKYWRQLVMYRNCSLCPESNLLNRAENTK